MSRGAASGSPGATENETMSPPGPQGGESTSSSSAFHPVSPSSGSRPDGGKRIILVIFSNKTMP
jgi:hypothetical protein